MFAYDSGFLLLFVQPHLFLSLLLLHILHLEIVDFLLSLDLCHLLKSLEILYDKLLHILFMNLYILFLRLNLDFIFIYYVL